MRYNVVPARRLFVLSLSLTLFLLAARMDAQMPPNPSIANTTPSIVVASHVGSWGISLEGKAMQPSLNAFGSNLTSTYFNTHVSQFAYATVQVYTVQGKLSDLKRCDPETFSSQGCKISSWGDSSLSLEINSLAFPEWQDGSELIFSFHLLIPYGSGVKDLASNYFHVPFSRDFSGPPVIDSLSPANFQSNSTSWQLQVAAHQIDKTIYLDISGNTVKPDSLPRVDASGSSNFTVTIPTAARTNGSHKLNLCRIWMDMGTYRTASSCSPLSTYTVTQVYERTGNFAAPNVQAVEANRAQIATSPIANNVRINPSIIAELATVQVTVTCASTPLYADVQLNPLTTAGRPLFAKAGQSFQARGTVRGANGKDLRSLSNNGTSYIDAACVK